MGIIFLNLAFLVWQIYELIDKGRIVFHPVFLAMDVFVNICLLSEIILRIIAMKLYFFKRFSNIFDIFIFGIGIFAIVVYIRSHYQEKDNNDVEEIDSLIIIVVNLVRYGTCFGRIASILRSIKKNVSNRKRKIILGGKESESLLSKKNSNDFAILQSDDDYNYSEPRIYDTEEDQ